MKSVPPILARFLSSLIATSVCQKTGPRPPKELLPTKGPQRQIDASNQRQPVEVDPLRELTRAQEAVLAPGHITCTHTASWHSETWN